MDAVVTELAVALRAQREGEFKKYRTEEAAFADAMKKGNDSEACKQLIADAKATLEAMLYDNSLTPKENIEKADAVITELIEALRRQRDKERKNNVPGPTADDKDAGNSSKYYTVLKKADVSKATGIVEIPKAIVSNGVVKTVYKIGADSYKKAYNLEKATMPASIKIIGRRAFKYCKNLKEVSLSQNLTRMNRSAFYGSGLEKVSLGDSISFIGSFSFKKCSNLTEVSLGKNVKEIGRSAFSMCTSLESITIPASVEKMGTYMFYDCTALKTVKIETTKLTSESLANGVFKKVPKDLVIYVPTEVLDDYRILFKAKGLKSSVKVLAY